MPELWLVEMADRFWQAAGGFSSVFEEALLFALPLNIERLDRLSVYRVQEWLTQRGFALSVVEPEQLLDRRLRACLVAHGSSQNFVLLDKNDLPNEQLFSLAHEVAHFMLDYIQPREKAERRLTSSILEVIDGVRPPTLDEKLYGLLGGVSIKPYEHFMERDSDGNILNGRILQVEDRADCLALELLAPEETALPLVQSAIKGEPTYVLRVEAATRILIEHFSLPNPVASSYAHQLVRLAGGNTTFREWLNF